MMDFAEAICVNKLSDKVLSEARACTVHTVLSVAVILTSHLKQLFLCGIRRACLSGAHVLQHVNTTLDCKACVQ
jgi:hypothetical protein